MVLSRLRLPTSSHRNPRQWTHQSLRRRASDGRLRLTAQIVRCLLGVSRQLRWHHEDTAASTHLVQRCSRRWILDIGRTQQCRHAMWRVKPRALLNLLAVRGRTPTHQTCRSRRTVHPRGISRSSSETLPTNTAIRGQLLMQHTSLHYRTKLSRNDTLEFSAQPCRLRLAHLSNPPRLHGQLQRT